MEPEIQISITTALEFQDLCLFQGISLRKSQQFNSMSFHGMYEPWNGHSIINYDFLTLMMVEGGHFKQRMKRRSRLDIRQHVLANRVVDR